MNKRGTRHSKQKNNRRATYARDRLVSQEALRDAEEAFRKSSGPRRQRRLIDDDERRGRYFPIVDGWSAVTALRIEGETIAFAGAARRTRVDSVALVGLLDRFANLKSNEAIVLFARENGALELCRHDYPRMHEPRWVTNSYNREGCAALWRETFTVWRRWIRCFSATLSIVEGLRQEKPRFRDSETWNAIGDALQLDLPLGQAMGKLQRLFNLEVDDERRACAAAQRTEVAQVINELSDAGGIRPVLTWGETRNAGLRTGWLYGSGLFGVLAHQLAIVATNDADRYTCAGCHETFTPPKRPPSGRTNYFCQACRDNGTARRVIDRNRYENHKRKAQIDETARTSRRRRGSH